METAVVTLAEATQRICAAAVVAEKETGFPAEIVAAQAALESGWLDRAPGNNAFGWKAIAGYERQLRKTTEWLDSHGTAEFAQATDGRRILRATGRTNGNKAEYEVMDYFAVFASLADAFSVHVHRLTTVPRYRAAWEEFKKKRWATEDDGIRFLAQGIAKAGYATDPNYATKLIQIALGKRIKEGIAIARARV